MYKYPHVTLMFITSELSLTHIHYTISLSLSALSILGHYHSNITEFTTRYQHVIALKIEDYIKDSIIYKQVSVFLPSYIEIMPFFDRNP